MRPTVVIRQIQSGEGAALRGIRLRAIRDTPEAFAVSLADTLAEPVEGWSRWATLNAAGETNIMFVVEDAGRWIGMAGGMLDTSRPGEVAQLISMWVDPNYRGQGLGRQLVEYIVGWVKERGVRRVELWVTENNGPAIRFYAFCGFEETGERQQLPSHPTLFELRMVREL